MAKKKNRKDGTKEAAGIFIPAGLFIGFGLGFLYDQLSAGMFLGLGIGFLLFGITMVFKK